MKYQFEIKPRWSNTRDDNFRLIVDQLLEQKIPSKLLSQFCFDFGWSCAEDPASSYHVFHEAADDNGIAVMWEA